MKHTHVFAAAAIIGGLTLAPAVASATEATFDRTLSVSSNVNVYVATGSGYVHISPGSDNQIHIVGHVKAGRGGWWDGGSPDDRVREIAAHPPIDQNGNTVRIGKREGDWQRNVTIDYEITTPKGSNV